MRWRRGEEHERKAIDACGVGAVTRGGGDNFVGLDAGLGRGAYGRLGVVGGAVAPSGFAGRTFLACDSMFLRWGVGVECVIGLVDSGCNYWRDARRGVCAKRGDDICALGCGGCLEATRRTFG